jgi:hypothetical protein
MKTPREKYHNDPSYRNLVSTLESLIYRAEFTPSEIREAAMFAAIRYESMRPRPYFIDPEVASALEVLDSRFVNSRGEHEKD